MQAYTLGAALAAPRKKGGTLLTVTIGIPTRVEYNQGSVNQEKRFHMSPGLQQRF